MPARPVARRTLLTLAAATALAAAGPALAQTQTQTFPIPGKPLRIVVPFPAGGQTDIQARLLAAKLQTSLGTTVLVDNKPGASSILGTMEVVRAPADGHTLLYTISVTAAQNPHLFSKLPYDPFKDLTPVMFAARSTTVLTVPAASPFNSVTDIVKFAKANPGKLNYASFSLGSTSDLVAELLQQATGTQMTHIPFKAGGLAAVIGGQVPLMLQPTTTALAQVQKGTLIALGTTSTKRLSMLPDVPSIDEIIPGFSADGWQGLMVPAGTPSPVVERLNRGIAAILAMAETTERFASLGIEPWPSSPQQMGAVIEQDTAKWGKVIRNARIEAQ